MNAVTLNDAKQNLEQLIEQTVANAEPTIVCTDKGQRVVFLSLDEFNSWQETLYLLANPANADHLRRSIAESNGGRKAMRELADE
jgi:antitoxin YefM